MADATTFCPNCRVVFRWTLLLEPGDDQLPESWSWMLGDPMPRPRAPGVVGEIDEDELTECVRCDREVEVLELTAAVRRALADARRGKP